jgi:hypothetical protein
VAYGYRGGTLATSLSSQGERDAVKEPPAEKLNSFSGRSRDRTCDFVRVKGTEEGANSMIARACNVESERSPDRDSACFSLSYADSSRSVTGSRAERTDRVDPIDPDARHEVRPEVEPPTTAREPTSTTSDDAIKLAIKLAVDAGEYERATALLDVAKRTAKPGKVMSIDAVRQRQ